MKAITLPSGATLEIGVTPFSISKALYQAILEETKALKLDPKAEIDVNLFKDLFCVGLSSKKIEEALAKCLKYATYSGLKIDDQTFEPIKAREDYIVVCYEVAKENIAPFMKNLYAQFSQAFELLKTKSPA